VRGRRTITPEQSAGFVLDHTGVFSVEESKDGDKPERKFVSGPLMVLARTRDERGDNWGKQLFWCDYDGHEHERTVPDRLLHEAGSPVVKMLADQGLQIGIGQTNRLTHYIQSRNPTARALCVVKPGWYNLGLAGQSKRVYVLPNATIGDSADEPVVFQPNSLERTEYLVTGTVATWQTNVGNLCAGNSRLVCSASLAFAAPLLEMVGLDGGGIHFYGPSSSGKTTILQVAASVWPHNFRVWRTTDNSLESTAELYNDCLLCLDELSQLDAGRAVDVAYMLANGKGKGRMSQDLTNQPVKSWKLLFLSTGELTFANHAETAGKQARGGVEVRTVNVDAVAGENMGVFESLHGVESAAKFADLLKANTQTNHGVVGVAFVEYVIWNWDIVKDKVEAYRSNFRKKYTPSGPLSGEIPRVIERFSLVAAAGEVATEAGLTGWPPGEAMKSVACCLETWLSQRSTGSSDMDRAVEQVKQFFIANGDSRFQSLDKTPDAAFKRVITNRAGFRYSHTPTCIGGFYIPTEVFHSEVCKGFDAKKVAQELAKRGHLNRSAKRFKVQKRLPGMGNNGVWVYEIFESIFGDDPTETEAVEPAIEQKPKARTLPKLNSTSVITQMQLSTQDKETVAA
jgi:putative DNA primase/helicase